MSRRMTSDKVESPGELTKRAGGDATPLAVRGTVVDSSGLKLNLWVWDINGDVPDDNYVAWDGKTLEVSYSIIGP